MTTSTSRRSSSDAGPDRDPALRRSRSLLTAQGTVHVLRSNRSDGDLHRGRVDPDTLERRRRALVDLPWTLLDQVHGTRSVTVERPGEHDGCAGDIAVVSASDAVVGVWTADCAPVVIVIPDGQFAVVHAGWRGLASGVLDEACSKVGIGGSAPPGSVAVLGPCIAACCNEFGAADLLRVARGSGVELELIAARTRWGTTALDVPALVGAVLARRRLALLDDAVCTGCDPRYFSHRIRRDRGRHVVAAWREAAR